MDAPESFKNINKGDQLLLLAIFKGDENLINKINAIYDKDEFILKAIYEKINSLNKIQQMILKLSFGIDGNEKHTAKTISRIIKLTPETVSKNKSRSINIIKQQLIDSAEKLSIIKLHESIKGGNIEELNLSNRVYICLKRYNINIIDDILEMNAYDLMSMRNFGIYRATELMNVMKSLKFYDWVNSITLDINDAIKSKNKPKMYEKLKKLNRDESHINKYKRTGLSVLSGDYDGDALEIY